MDWIAFQYQQAAERAERLRRAERAVSRWERVVDWSLDRVACVVFDQLRTIVCDQLQIPRHPRRSGGRGACRKQAASAMESS